MWKGYLSIVRSYNYNTFTTKACGEVFKIQSQPLYCNSEKVLQLLRCKLVVILPILENLKQTFIFRLIFMKVNTNLFEKKNRIYHRSVFIHTIFKIVTEILMIGKFLYLRNVKCTNNLKKRSRFGNTTFIYLFVYLSIYIFIFYLFITTKHKAPLFLFFV